VRRDLRALEATQAPIAVAGDPLDRREAEN
jgi:hypothetical protein